MEEEEEEDCESLHSPSLSSPSFSFSSHNLSPIRTTPRHPLLHNDLSIFPPINHEGLPIPPGPPPPPRAPLCLSSSDSDSQPPSPSTRSSDSHFAKWFDFALHLWNSKLQSFLTRVRSLGFFHSLRLVVAIVPILLVLWCWVRRLRWRRWQRCSGQENVEQLKLLIKEKDEKIIQLLEQIAQMNKLLLSRFRIPVIKSS